MIEMTLASAAQAMNGTLHGADARFRGVSTDTRSIAAGELFVALQGPNFDGNSFVADAAAANAAGAVTDRGLDTGMPLITVADTRIALGDLARNWRATMPAKIVGITGSNGKTTLKEMLASCLSVTAKTLATEGNLNNDIGVPLMLCRLGAEHQFAIIEMGANNPGEIGYLAAMARADVVVITNAGPAHLEGFGSVEGVARAKGEILETEERPAYAILNADDPYFDYWADKASDLNVVSFGTVRGADVRAMAIRPTERGSQFSIRTPSAEFPVELQLPGLHNVRNACAAAAIAHVLEVPALEIKQGLDAARAVSGRLREVFLRDGVSVYDDSYNANPDSVAVAADFLAGLDGTSVLVLGDMAELGGREVALHGEVGRAAKRAGIDYLYACGNLSRAAVAAFGEGGQWFESVDALCEALRGDLHSGWRILVKGSRATRMERVIEALAANEQVN
jgi:UDP-N-acetylmuramoyl-tripeptide--D-alanyl-D-alanine ligase